MDDNNENGDDSGGNDVFDEDELSPSQVLLLHGYKPAALLPWGAVKYGNEKGESAN